jgi:RecA/RadA recombinase
MPTELPPLTKRITLPTPLAPDADPNDDPFIQLKKRFGMYSGMEVTGLARQLPTDNHLVEGLIPRSSVNILVGDSGIGKSPMAYQIALAVAGGAPFLGLRVRTGKVIFADYENHLRDVSRIVDQQRKHLGLEKIPSSFLFWPLSRTPELENMESVVDSLSPELVVIDSLRAFRPEMETDSVKAVQHIRKLRAIAASRGTAFLLIHHVRKQQLQTGAGLEDGHALDWLRRAAGTRALVNQTDVRLALARRAPAKVRTEGAADLVLSGHFRTRGDVGPFLIRRIWDADGEPVGYQRFEANPALMANEEQERAFHQLSEEFTFGEACRALGKVDESTNWFIHKLVRLGLARKVGRGKYRKCILCAREGVTTQ